VVPNPQPSNLFFTPEFGGLADVLVFEVSILARGLLNMKATAPRHRDVMLVHASRCDAVRGFEPQDAA